MFGLSDDAAPASYSRRHRDGDSTRKEKEDKRILTEKQQALNLSVVGLISQR